jgi:hypothetical protein
VIRNIFFNEANHQKKIYKDGAYHIHHVGFSLTHISLTPKLISHIIAVTIYSLFEKYQSPVEMIEADTRHFKILYGPIILPIFGPLSFLLKAALLH